MYGTEHNEIVSRCENWPPQNSKPLGVKTSSPHTLTVTGIEKRDAREWGLGTGLTRWRFRV